MKHSFTSIARALAVLTFALSAQNTHAEDFGYCTGNVSRDNIFRVGTSEKQGLAIRLNAAKLQLLKGSTIKTISVAFGSKNLYGKAADLFISTDPTATPLVTQQVEVSSSVKWLTFTLSNPYTITGSEPELYIGYTGEIYSTSSMLLADKTFDLKGCSYAYEDGKWVDTYGMGYGNASIRLGIEGATGFADLVIKPYTFEGFFKAGNEYPIKGQVFNFGTQTITSFDIEVTTNGAGRQTKNVTGVSIAPGEAYDFTLPITTAAGEGSFELAMSATNINGKADSDPTDNTFAAPQFNYPANMERAILIEGFTGQACSNCPNAHTLLNQFVAGATTTPVIEVMHHSGYSPDFFTTKIDNDCLYFYNSQTQYAPGLMFNRTPTNKDVPVFNPSNRDLLDTAYKIVENNQPYVSLSLSTEYDPQTRNVSISFTTYTHCDLPAEINVINLVWVQDKLVSSQVPYGDGYTHNAVTRGTLTGNSWGITMDKASTKAGGSYTYTKTLTLPTEILSDHYAEQQLTEAERAKCTWPVVPENMKLVAYVTAFGDSHATRQVYNAIEVPLGKSHEQGGFVSAIAPCEAPMPRISVSGGRIIVDGEYDSLRVFSIGGAQANPNALAPGIYIVRMAKGNNVNSVKISVK